MSHFQESLGSSSNASQNSTQPSFRALYVVWLPMNKKDKFKEQLSLLAEEETKFYDGSLTELSSTSKEMRAERECNCDV